MVKKRIRKIGIVKKQQVYTREKKRKRNNANGKKEEVYTKVKVEKIKISKKTNGLYQKKKKRKNGNFK